MKTKIQKFNNIVLLILIILGMFLRFYVMTKHFTHVDDDICVWSIMGRVKNIDTENIFYNLCLHMNAMFGFQTYAPFQLLFISYLVSPLYNYKTNMIYGRFPSMIFGCLSIFMLYFILRKSKNENNYSNIDEKHIFPSLITMALLVFSWENIIYSSQAEPYEIVVFFGLIIIYILKIKPYKKMIYGVITTIILAIGCYAHFQFYYIVFSYYLTLFIVDIKNKNNIDFIKHLIFSILNLLLCVYGIISFINTNMFDHSLNWNRGINNIFCFTIPSDNIFSNLIYIIEFFVRNTIIIYRYFFTVTDIYAFSLVFAIVLIALTIVGIVNIFKNNKKIFLFYAILFFISFILIVLQKLTYGPSRHSLYLFPFLLYLIYEGIIHLCNKWAKVIYVVGTFTIINVILFAAFFNKEMTMRQDFTNEKKYNQLANEYNVDGIFFWCDFSSQPLLTLNGYNSVLNDYRAAFYIKNNYKNIDNNNENNNNVSKKILVISCCIGLDVLLDREDWDNKTYRDLLNKYYNINDIKDYNILYKDIFVSGYEVEYDSRDYNNHGNGKYIYVLQYD